MKTLTVKFIILQSNKDIVLNLGSSLRARDLQFHTQTNKE
jgi:hypothetical protein